MAEVYYMHIAPHCAIGPVAFSASLHVDAVVPNFLIQEQIDAGLGDGLFIEDWHVTDGHIELPTKPGLGTDCPCLVFVGSSDSGVDKSIAHDWMQFRWSFLCILRLKALNSSGLYVIIVTQCIKFFQLFLELWDVNHLVPFFSDQDTPSAPLGLGLWDENSIHLPPRWG